jgi:hypothetical protein
MISDQIGSHLQARFIENAIPSQRMATRRLTSRHSSNRLADAVAEIVQRFGLRVTILKSRDGGDAVTFLIPLDDDVEAGGAGRRKRTALPQ